MTTKAQKVARRQARHNRQVARRLEKKNARLQDAEAGDEDAVEDDDIQEGDEVSELDADALKAVEEEGIDLEGGDEIEEARHPEKSDEPEVIGKDYGTDGAYPEMAPIGATSWDELDAERDAEAQAQRIRSASWDVGDLVRNILNHPVMDTDEKATAIQAVGSGFKSRIGSIISDGQSVQKDLELLEVEALIASDRRHTSTQERISDWITKATLTAGARNALAPSQFALVVTRGGKKIKKYPIHDKAHVRNALARAAQGIKRGGQAASDARAALPKIHAAAKRMGIGMGKDRDANAIILQKDAHGDWRWVGWVSNNYIDWHGDIISKAGHEEYVGFLNKNPDMAPLFMSWHTPGTQRKEPADYWTFENGFLIMSGKLTEPEAAGLFKAMASTDLGMSFSGVGLRDPADPRVITKYRAFEVSDLPLADAANPFTDFSIVVKESEVDMDKKQYLAEILGSVEQAEAFLKKTGLKQQALDQAGVEKKSADGAQETKPAPVEKVATKLQTAVTAAAAQPADAKAIVEQVMQELQVDDLNEFVKQAQEAIEKIPILEGVIKDMQASGDEKLAEKINPPASRFAWARKERASAAASTVIKADDELAQKKPDLGWLSQVTGTAPIEAEPVQQ